MKTETQLGNLLLYNIRRFYLVTKIPICFVLMLMFREKEY